MEVILRAGHRQGRPPRRGRERRARVRAQLPLPARPRRRGDAVAGGGGAEGRERRASSRRRRSRRRSRSPRSSARSSCASTSRPGQTGSLFGSVTPTDITDELWTKHKIRVDRRKVGTDTIKRIGRFQVPIELFQDVTAEVRTLVVPEGGELPPEEELQAMEAAEANRRRQRRRKEGRARPRRARRCRARAGGSAHRDRRAAAFEEDVAGELQEDEFDRAVDAGTAEEPS